MEFVFIGPALLPIPPSKIEITKPGGNETVRLINQGEINVRHSPGLATYSFDVILPSSQSYPFQIYSLAGMEASAFTTYFDLLQKRKIPFPFITVSWGAGLAGNIASLATGALSLTYGNSLCTIEDQVVTRDAENGMDYVVSLTLKQYKEYGTKWVKVSGRDSKDNFTFKVDKQTTSFSYMQELGELSSECFGALGATWKALVSMFEKDTYIKAIKEAEDNFMKGW